MNKLIVEPSPHIKSKNSTNKVMAHVIIAMMPAFGMSAYIFGPRAFLLCIVCVISCLIFEILFRRLIRKDKGIDPSPAVTGLLLAFCLPVTMPVYMAVIGCFIAIVVVKQLFGGLGQNFANPAITARIALMLSFTAQMTSWAVPFYYKEADAVTVAAPLTLDAVTGATPLALLKAGGQPPGLWDLFMGYHGGCLGETCVAALLIGFVYLTFTKIIHPAVPVAFVGTVALGSFAAGLDVGVQVLSGGLILGAVFMATDYATSPVTTKGKLIFGIGCGFITLVIRIFAEMPEGVSFAILIMNILTVYIDKITVPRAFGAKRASRLKKAKEGADNA